MAEFLTSDAIASRHGFFTRKGGVSEGIYGSLQCGWGAKSDTTENVRENRRRAAEALSVIPERLVSVYQIHSARCVMAGQPWSHEVSAEADAMASRTPGMALGVLTADCAPVLFEDREAGVVGAAHAGWRGALDGVLEATVRTMCELGAKPGRIHAAVGPCIGPQAYEVGPEYVERFLAADPENQRFFENPYHQPGLAGGRSHFNLPAYVLSRLADLNLADAQWIGRCTFAEPELFYSNRRALHAGEPDYGRLLSVIRVPDAA